MTKNVLTIMFLLICIKQASALDFYWKGTNNGDFNDPNMWWVGSFGSGVTASQSPISSDNVFFTAAAFSAPGRIIEITSNSSCNNMFWDSAILVANQPRLRCTNATVNLDVHGNLTLIANMLWSFSGNLRLKSVQPAGTIHNIVTAGKRILVNSLVFEASNLVEYVLVDSLYVDDPTEANANLSQGGIILNGGYLNCNGKSVRADNFTSFNNNIKRRLNISNSRVTLNRYHEQYAWNVDFNSLLATPNFSGFSAAGSHIIQNGYYYTYMRFGTGIKYDSITFDTEFASPIGDQYAFIYVDTRNGSDRDTFEHVFAKRQVCMVYDNSKMIFKNLHIYPQTIISASSSGKTIEVENIFNYSGCNEFPTIGASSFRGWTENLTIRKITPGTLTMNNVILSRVNCDVGGGRIYIANNSANKGGNTNITINAGTGREMYFRAIAGNQDWHNIANWRENNSGVLINSSCLPTPFDNVYFDGSSFNTNNRVEYTRRAYCRDMRWLTTVPTNAQLRGGNLLHIFGDLQYDSKMTFGTITSAVGGNYRSLLLCGNNIDSIITNSAINNTINVLLESYSDYRIVGNYTGLLNGGEFSRMRMLADTLRPTDGFAMSFGNFDGTQIYISGGSWAFYMRNHSASAISYSGNATVHWTQVATQSQYSFYGGYLPNLIVYGGMNSNYSNVYITGNLTLKKNAFMYMGNTQFGGTERGQLHVIGGLNGANGNLIMEEGSNLVFTSLGGTNSFLRVLGNFTANGSCQKNVSITTHDGAPLQGGFSVAGAVNISYANIQGMRNISPAPNSLISVSNSSDGGNNTGWTFNTASTQTYYWRALRGNPTVFAGDWYNSGHWTTNPANLVGDSLCVPSLYDDVVFDSLSFSAVSNNCTVSSIAYCRDILVSGAARLTIGNSSLFCRHLRFTHSAARWDGTLGNDVSPSKIYISGDLILATNMTALFYRGDIHMIGSGDIRSNGSRLQARALIFNKIGGTWNLRDALYLDNDWAGTNTVNRRAGEMRLLAGTLNSNNFNITISSYFNSGNIASARALNLGSSIFTHRATAWYYFIVSTLLWNVNATNFTFTANPNAEIIFMPSTTFNSNLVNTRLDFFMGNGINYPKVSISDTDQNVSIYGASNYNYLQLEANAYVDANNTMDSIRLEGGFFYRFKNGSIQTLRAPHGHVISNGTSSDFVNIESSTPGSSFRLHKPFGPAFCIDFVKVKDCIGTKETNMALIPTSPVNYQTIHPFLEFQTGVNSDNIGGTATGIWAFSLPILVTPQFVGSNFIQPCGISLQQSFTIPVTGTGPYMVNYSWVSGPLSGMGVITSPDNDNNSNTPMLVTIPINTTNSSITYTFNITTFRCGEETTPLPRTAVVTQNSPAVLTQTPQTSACDFNNSSAWLTLLGNSDTRPVVSIQDSTGPSDFNALGTLTTQIYFDPTVQQVNIGGIMYPYLQRHWHIQPTNNGAARVRLYFTQAELNALIAASTTFGVFSGVAQLQVVRYASGTIGVGPEQIIPHTIIPLSGSAAAPFSSTANVYAFEFFVPSFSHFIITPTQNILLDFNLLSFTAEKQGNRDVLLNWKVEKSIDTDLYQVERSRDGINSVVIGEINSNHLATEDNYSFVDLQAKDGLNYYRLRAIESTGKVNLSDWRAVEIGNSPLVKIMPNPAVDMLTIEINASSGIELCIINQLGQSVKLENFIQSSQIHNINISDLPSGIYTLQIFLVESGTISIQQLVIE